MDKRDNRQTGSSLTTAETVSAFVGGGALVALLTLVAPDVSGALAALAASAVVLAFVRRINRGDDPRYAKRRPDPP